MTQSTLYAGLAFLAGIGIPIMAALNAGLGHRLGSAPLAASILFAVALVGSILFWSLSGAQSGVAAALNQPFTLYTGGLFVAFYVLMITWMAPRFGVGNAVFFVLLGQLVSAVLIDHFGWNGAPQVTLNPQRIVGVGLMTVGVFLARIF